MIDAACRCPVYEVAGGVVQMYTPACAVHGGSGLSDRQREALQAIEDGQQVGRSPTIAELGRTLGGVTTNAVCCLLNYARAKGVLTGEVGKSRALRVLPLAFRRAH